MRIKEEGNFRVVIINLIIKFVSKLTRVHRRQLIANLEMLVLSALCRESRVKCER